MVWLGRWADKSKLSVPPPPGWPSEKKKERHRNGAPFCFVFYSNRLLLQTACVLLHTGQQGLGLQNQVLCRCVRNRYAVELSSLE